MNWELEEARADVGLGFLASLTLSSGCLASSVKANLSKKKATPCIGSSHRGPFDDAEMTNSVYCIAYFKVTVFFISKKILRMVI